MSHPNFIFKGPGRIWLLAIAVFLAIASSVTIRVKTADAGLDSNSLFSPVYPLAERFQLEVKQLRSSKRLTAKNEDTIENTVLASSNAYEIPPSLLWCLLFQESRLNHLAGIETYKNATGLGQFSYFSFYEINHQLKRYQEDGRQKLISLLGSDVRPIRPDRNNLSSPSSYYNIPTAVVASAAYLRNRYLHLNRLLNKHGYESDPELIWLSAAAAYNKGTRSILAFWNHTQRKKGRGRMQEVLTSKPAFFDAIGDLRLLTGSMKRIWSVQQSLPYAKELQTHVLNIRDCAVQKSQEPSQKEGK